MSGQKNDSEPNKAKSLDTLVDKIAVLEQKLDSLESRCKQFEDDLSHSDSKSIEETGDKDPGAKEQTDDEKPSPNQKARGRVVINKFDQESGERKDYDSEEPLQRERKRGITHVFLLRKVLSDDEPTYGEIEIYDANLHEFLGEKLRHYPYHTYLGDSVFIKSPYESIVLNWDLLVSEANRVGSSEEDSLTRSHLGELLDTIRSGSGDSKLDQYLSLRDSYLKQESITFDTLWTIFPPGTIVFGRPFLKQEQIFIVDDNVHPWPFETNYGRSRSPRTWFLKCLTYDWNGQFFQRRLVSLSFDEFEGQKPIASLPYHPLENDPAKADIRKRLLKRGKTFRNYCTATNGDRLYYYKGPAIFVSGGFRGVQAEIQTQDDDDTSSSLFEGRVSNEALKSQQITGNVMVDYESYFKYGEPAAQIGHLHLSDYDSECTCSVCSQNVVLRDIYKTSYDSPKDHWDDLQYMLCPPRVLGYILHEKQWAQLSIEEIRDIPEIKERDSWTTKLKLAGDENGKETKELLMGLVKNHGSGEFKKGDNGFEVKDLVPDKGKGLIILLYGPPGVGKTSTAQTVAEAARKPLFSIGVADVGTKAKHVESNLKKIFDLATTWRAILLIDEADVFLQSRTRGGMGPTTERNALVSVFLRVLEYYQGILILTTNQIAQFDIAVQSRIHVAIKYQELDRDQTVAIFEEFLGQYAKAGAVDEQRRIEDYVKKELYKKRFDGRQVRNIVTSAMGLARSNEKKLKLEHVKHVVSIVEDFKNDLSYHMMQYQDTQRGK